MSAEDLIGDGRLARWRAKAGLDFHVLVTLLFRGWSVLAGAGTVLLVPLCLSSAEQGYYYTFASVLALQIFFELGLNQVVMQLVSHEAAHLTLAAQGRFEGPLPNLARLGSLVRLMRRWYTAAAVLFAAIGGPAGMLFFQHQGTLPTLEWLGTWCVLVGATALNLWYSARLAMLEGCGQVGHVARLRLLQSMVGYALLWTALLGGAGLWATVVLPLVSGLGTAYWLSQHGHALQDLARYPAADAAHRISWRTDVLPLQWRIALSWISGYFIFNLFTPLVFSYHGPVEAGRLGMALTVFTAVSTIGMSWINAKAPQFAMHIARGERQALNELFKAVARRSIAFTTATCFIVVAVAWGLAAWDMPVMARIAPPAVLATLALVTSVNSAVFAAATYMRAHREEPMLPVSVVTAVLTSLAAYQGSRLSILAMMMLYAAVTVLVTLPWTAGLFMRYFKRTT